MKGSIAQLLEDHRELRVMAERLRSIVSCPVADSAAIAVLRWQICCKLTDHCGVEERSVYELLITSGDPEAVQLTLALRDEVGCLDSDVRAYVAEWPMERINREWARFGAVTQALLDRLAHRMVREEREVFPELARIVQRRAA